MAVAAILVCAVPLFSRLTITAGMRAALAADPDNALLLASGYPITVSSAVFRSAQDTIDGDVRNYVGPYLSPSSAHYMQMQGFPVLWQTNKAPAGANPHSERDTMDLIGTTAAVATADSKLMQGSWPQASSTGANTAEAAIAADAATQLG